MVWQSLLRSRLAGCATASCAARPSRPQALAANSHVRKVRIAVAPGCRFPKTSVGHSSVGCNAQPQKWFRECGSVPQRPRTHPCRSAERLPPAAFQSPEWADAVDQRLAETPGEEILSVSSELGALAFAPSSTPTPSRTTSSPPSQPVTNSSAVPRTENVRAAPLG